MRKVLKWLGIGLGGLLGLVLIAATVLFFIGRSKLGRTYKPGPVIAAAPADPASVARGEHLVRIHACTFCHGDNLGGKRFLDIPPALVIPPNLTRGKGGVGGRYRPADWDGAVRYGVRPGGKMLLPFMPYHLYNRLGDTDMAAMAAYLGTLPPVDNDTLPKSKFRPLGFVMLATMDPREGLDDPRSPMPAQVASAEYGRYLASTTCVECHGDRLQGGKHPDPSAPPVPGLAGAGTWTREGFARAMRTGVTPYGRRLSDAMPWEIAYRHLSDDEIAGLHLYIQSLYPQPAAAPAR